MYGRWNDVFITMYLRIYIKDLFKNILIEMEFSKTRSICLNILKRNELIAFVQISYNNPMGSCIISFTWEKKCSNTLLKVECIDISLLFQSNAHRNHIIFIAIKIVDQTGNYSTQTQNTNTYTAVSFFFVFSMHW